MKYSAEKNNMTDAKRDDNYIPTLLGLSNADGSTPVRIRADVASNNGLCIKDGTSGSDSGGDHAIKDNNMIPVMIVVSSADGITPIAVYADPSNSELLTKST